MKRNITITFCVLIAGLLAAYGLTHFYESKKTKKRQELALLTLEQTANDFHLELHIISGDVPTSTEGMQKALQPTEATYYLLERWEEVHLIDPKYPYPETKIEEQDWIGMNKFLYEDGNKADMKLNEEDRPVYYYILFGTPSDHPVVQEAIERVENQLSNSYSLMR